MHLKYGSIHHIWVAKTVPLTHPYMEMMPYVLLGIVVWCHVYAKTPFRGLHAALTENGLRH